MVALIAAGSFSIYRRLRDRAPDVPVPKSFYSDDDGKTWFLDAADKAPPFDHNGKEAFQAVVCRCGNGTPFVSYLISYDPEDKAAIEAAAPNNRIYVIASLSDKQLVKRPGGGSWVRLTPQSSKEYKKISTPLCPDGSAKDLTFETPPAG